MKDLKISDLTIDQFRQLIKETVQESVVEVLIEFQIMADAEEQLRYEAEMTDYLRMTMGRVPRAEHANEESVLDD